MTVYGSTASNPPVCLPDRSSNQRVQDRSFHLSARAYTRSGRGQGIAASAAPATSPAQYLAPSRPSKQAKNASPRPKQGGGCCSRVKARASAFSRKAEAATHASLGVLLGGQQRGGANDEVCGNLGGTGSRGRLLRPCSDRGVGRDSVGRHHSRQAHQHAVGALVRLRVQPASKQVRQSPQRWGLQAERSEPPPTDGCEGRL